MKIIYEKGKFEWGKNECKIEKKLRIIGFDTTFMVIKIE